MADRSTGTYRRPAVPPDQDDVRNVGIGLLPRSGLDDPAAPRDAAAYDAVLTLTVSKDGAVFGVLPGRGPPPLGIDPNRAPETLEAFWPPEVCAQVCTHIRQAIRGRQVHSADFEMGESTNMKLVFIPHGRDTALVVVLDTSAQKSSYTRMQKLAYVDKATTLPTREYLLEEMRRFTSILKLKEHRAAVICLSLEQGDERGNTLGGHSQDIILKELASRLTLELRGANRREETDYERYSVAARIDYRQYGVLLPSIQSGADAESVAVRLIESLQSPIAVGDRRASVRVRAGIALFPQDGTDAETLLENALSAMEDARNSQADSYKFHSGTVNLRALQRQDLELELQAALDREEFSLHYLPIVDAKTRQVTSVEALLRWPQATFGTKPIQKIVALAECMGLILPIGDWVLRKSIAQLQNWHARGHPSLRLSLNVSMQQFARPEFLERVKELLATHTIAPNFVDLEITEYMLFRDALSDYATCTAFKEHGLGIVVDNYGTGACSLAHFSRGPVAGIKIDNRFVTNMTTDTKDRNACAAMIALAHELDLEVIAQGIETAGQAALLIEQGCDFLQGFLFTRPLPAAEIAGFLTAR